MWFPLPIGDYFGLLRNTAFISFVSVYRPIRHSLECVSLSVCLSLSLSVKRSYSDLRLFKQSIWRLSSRAAFVMSWGSLAQFYSSIETRDADESSQFGGSIQRALHSTTLCEEDCQLSKMPSETFNLRGSSCQITHREIISFALRECSGEKRLFEARSSFLVELAI